MLGGVRDEELGQRNGNPKKFGDFPQLRAPKPMHLERDTRALGQLRHRVHDALDLVSVKRYRFRRRGLVGTGFRRPVESALGKQPAFTHGTPPPVDGEVSDDPVQISLRIVEKAPLGRLVEPQPGFLNQVFRKRSVSDDAARIGDKRGPVRHEQAQG